MSEHITKPGKSGAMVTEGLLTIEEQLQLTERDAKCAAMREALRLALDCRVCIVDEDENPKYVELRLTREARLAVSKALSSSAGKEMLERVKRAEGLLRRVDELQKVDINPALDAIDDPLGQQAAAWGSDWTDLLSAIDAFAFLKGGEPRG